MLGLDNSFPKNTISAGFKKLPAQMDGVTYSWCPTMDLMAISANNGKSVWIYRMNGEKVWEIAIEEGICKDVAWKPDGRQMAVLTTKTKCLIYDVNTARLLTTLVARDENANFGNWVALNPGDKQANKFHGVFDFDVSKSLPRLLPLPNAVGKKHIFSTKQAIDGLIQNNKVEDLDLLFLLSEEKVNIILHGLFSLGSVNILPNNESDEEIVKLASHNIEDHYVLTTSFTIMKHTLRHFKARFLLNHAFLQDLALSISKIIALIGYVDEVLMFASQEIKAYLDFSNRFIGILKDEVEKNGQNVVDELYNLLLTGMMNDEVKDWFENTIGDRGVKRWEKIGENTFESVRRTFIYHLIPASERIIILLTKLESISTLSLISSEKLEFELQFLNESIESVKSFLKQVFDFINSINKEQELFDAYILWINATLVELQEDPPKHTFATSEVSEFISNHLQRSVLAVITPNLRRNFNDIKINTTDLFDSARQQLKNGLLPSDYKIELGRVCEKPVMFFVEDKIYVFSHYDSTLDIFKVNVDTNEVQNVSIEFINEVLDLKTNESDEVYVISGNEFKSFDFLKLFKELSTNEIKEDSLTFLKRRSFGKLSPKYLTVNRERNIGTIFSDDGQTYHVFFLNDS